ncbi:unnamed protein product, partial [Rotaria magnacalcarata]
MRRGNMRGGGRGFSPYNGRGGGRGGGGGDQDVLRKKNTLFLSYYLLCLILHMEKHLDNLQQRLHSSINNLWCRTLGNEINRLSSSLSNKVPVYRTGL